MQLYKPRYVELLVHVAVGSSENFEVQLFGGKIKVSFCEKTPGAIN